MYIMLPTQFYPQVLETRRTSGPRGRQEPAWMCGGIRHWDCREFVSEGCAKGSYRHQLSGFFNVSAL